MNPVRTSSPRYSRPQYACSRTTPSPTERANAACAAATSPGAERYLAKTGDSPEAVYARGALAIRQKDYDGARRYLNEAKSLGLEQAAITLEQLGKNDINEYKYH